MATHDLNTYPWLSDDIIFCILLILPVKTLLRFRSVSKSWLSLISSSEFIKTHLRKSTNDPHFIRHHLLLSDKPYMPSNFEGHSLYSLLNEPVTEAIECDFTDINTIVVGYCNGLACLRSFAGLVFFWNPSTRKLRRLPIGEHGGFSYGFGYDGVNDEFKVFVIFAFSKSEKKVSVYSSKSDSWRTIRDLTFATSWPYDGGYFANGAIHWNVRHTQSQCYFPKPGTIFSLDINTETCKEILRPKYEGSDRYTLNTFGESLCLVYDIGRTCDFWVLEKCGLEECWTKLFSIPCMDEVTWYPWMTPICISLMRYYSVCGEGYSTI